MVPPTRGHSCFGVAHGHGFASCLTSNQLRVPLVSRFSKRGIQQLRASWHCEDTTGCAFALRRRQKLNRDIAARGFEIEVRRHKNVISRVGR
jgi:hypothetical protein